MSNSPEADAFVRAILRDPADETTRLVFADWLDDTGEPHNAAWAGYIRAKATAARHEFGSPGWEDGVRAAAAFAPNVLAGLNLSARHFLDSATLILCLLPGPSISVRLAEVVIPRSVVETVPESVARENVALPLALQTPF